MKIWRQLIGNSFFKADAGYRDVGQAGAPNERPVSDAGDRQASDCAGDVHRTAGTGVSRDSDRAVVGRVSVLGLHCGGKRQQQQRQQSRGAGGS